MPLTYESDIFLRSKYVKILSDIGCGRDSKIRPLMCSGTTYVEVCDHLI